MRSKLTIILSFIFILNISAQEKLLQSGPMVAYSTMKEVMLWVQTTKSAEVYFEYWDVKAPQKRFKTEQIITAKQQVFVAHLLADQIEPSTQYNYELFINNKKVTRPYRLEFQSQPIWLWRGDAPDFSFATGSCAYIGEPKYDRPGEPYGGDYQIFKDIYEKDPDFMLWSGDNVYLRESDWNSRTGILHRHTHTRSNPEMQAMLGSMHHYSTWDDHDYGPNNSDRSYPLRRTAEEAYKLFFPSPNYVFEKGVTGKFQWADCEFFLLDNRYWRTPARRTDINPHSVLGEHQIEWLLDQLVNSYAPFKFVVIGGQFLSSVERFERHINSAPEERMKIINAIKELQIPGVVFLTGDVHHTELSKLDLENGYPLYDLTVSPLTSGAYGNDALENELHVEGTLVKERNYAHLKIVGNRAERAMEINVYDSNGKKLWDKTIKAADLKFKKE